MAEPRFLARELPASELSPSMRTEIMGPQNEPSSAHAELARLKAELAAEKAISLRSSKERDWVLTAAYQESTRLAAELATERATSARLLLQHSEILQGRGSARQHVVLSSYIGEYTSEFLDAKTPSQRRDLQASIHRTTKDIWDLDGGLSWEHTIEGIRKMMMDHGFVFREPGEGKIGWIGYAMHVPHVEVVEQLDRVVRAHRDDLGAVSWYLNELTAVLFRVAQYLEKNP